MIIEPWMRPPQALQVRNDVCAHCQRPKTHRVTRRTCFQESHDLISQGALLDRGAIGTTACQT